MQRKAVRIKAITILQTAQAVHTAWAIKHFNYGIDTGDDKDEVDDVSIVGHTVAHRQISMINNKDNDEDGENNGDNDLCSDMLNDVCSGNDRGVLQQSVLTISNNDSNDEDGENNGNWWYNNYNTISTTNSTNVSSNVFGRVDQNLSTLVLNESQIELSTNAESGNEIQNRPLVVITVRGTVTPSERILDISEILDDAPGGFATGKDIVMSTLYGRNIAKESCPYQSNHDTTNDTGCSYCVGY